MKKSYFIPSLFILAISLIAEVNAMKVCRTYDEFPSENLNNSKWSEIPGSDINSLFPDEHYVNVGEERYHTSQLIQGDRGVTLQIKNYNFSVGETLEYDAYYNSGTGNVLSRINVNGLWGDTGVQTPACEGQSFATGGAIGFWNGLSCVGQDIKGKYHVKIHFLNGSVDVNFTDPNGAVITYSPIFYSSQPYILGVSTRTGDNGIAHIDYDNFTICSEIPDSDGDGIIDTRDFCPNTLPASQVDGKGCSAPQFCSQFNPIKSIKSIFFCISADWKNNEKSNPKDCFIGVRSNKLSCLPFPNID